MSDEQDKLKVSLEPPKLFGRKKKPGTAGSPKDTAPAPAKARRPAAAPSDESVDEPVEEPLEETVEAEPVIEPEPVDETAPEPEVEPVAETAPVEPIEPVDPVEDDTDDTAVIDAPAATEPDPAPVPEPAPEPAPKPVPQKAARPAAKKPAASVAGTTTTPKAAPPAKKPGRPRAKLAPPIEPEPVTAVDHEDAAITGREEADEGPLLDMYPAAAATGAVVGAALVLLTWLSLRGCEAVRGTSTCTGGPGLLLLVATFVVSILLGSTLLKTFRIPDPGSSSFLAVGLVAVVALLFLIDALDHWSMIIVIPLLSVGAYLASVWVTKTFVEPTDTIDT